jgi:hypothetical protein
MMEEWNDGSRLPNIPPFQYSIIPTGFDDGKN